MKQDNFTNAFIFINLVNKQKLNIHKFIANELVPYKFYVVDMYDNYKLS